MSAPTPAEWKQLANLNAHNAQQTAEIKADRLAGRHVSRGRVLRLRKSCDTAVRLQKALNKRAGAQ
jgi:hypothetical protein